MTLDAKAATALLDVQNLCVQFRSRNSVTRVVDGLSFQLHRGRALALVGESGCGKTLTCRAIVRLLPQGATVSGSVRFDGSDLLALPEKELRRRRGRDIAMVFQDAATALNPTLPIGKQIVEGMRQHAQYDASEMQRRAVELLDLLRVPSALQRFQSYPHELSGGMRQRVLLAIALAAGPRLLIADETTRSLDALTQAQTLALLRDLQRQLGLAVLLVSHDLRMARDFSDDILVMYAGRAVEKATTQQVFQRPRMPYTQALIQAIPRLDRPAPARARAIPAGIPVHHALLSVRHVSHDIGSLRVLDDVSFDLHRGETLALIGESGSGKTTLAHTLLQMPAPTSGVVAFRGQQLNRLSGRALRETRRHIQLIFQDPAGSLDPTWRVSQIVEEPLIAHGVGSRVERQRRVAKVLELAGLGGEDYSRRRPWELSGGQCQRVAIARALTLEPDLILCDEAVSALDPLMRAQLLNLFEQLRVELGLSYLFISHDLPLVCQISDRVAVLLRGQICEIGPVASVYRHPRHPYSAALIAASEGLQDPQVFAGIDADPTSPSPTSAGCRFCARCPRARDRCRHETPVLRQDDTRHAVACHFPLDATAATSRSEGHR